MIKFNEDLFTKQSQFQINKDNVVMALCAYIFFMEDKIKKTSLENISYESKDIFIDDLLCITIKIFDHMEHHKSFLKESLKYTRKIGIKDQKKMIDVYAHSMGRFQDLIPLFHAKFKPIPLESNSNLYGYATFALSFLFAESKCFRKAYAITFLHRWFLKWINDESDDLEDTLTVIHNDILFFMDYFDINKNEFSTTEMMHS